MNRKLIHVLLSATVIATLVSAAIVQAAEPGIPALLRLNLLCKAMTFDRNLESRCGTEIVMAILYQSRYQASVSAKEDFIGAARASKITHIRNTPLIFQEIDLDANDWKSKLTELNADVIYLMATRSFDVGAVSSFARANQLLTLSADPTLVEEGLSLSIRLAANRPKFVINLNASRSEGADFSSQLLGLAEVLE